MTLEFNRMLKKCVSVTLNQVLNLIQDLTISGSRKIPILLDAELVKNLRTVTPAEAGVQGPSKFEDNVALAFLPAGRQVLPTKTIPMNGIATKLKGHIEDG